MADEQKKSGFFSDLFAPVGGFGVTFATMFRKVATTPRSTPRRSDPPSRASTVATSSTGHPDGLEKCVGCELCAWACPADAILVEGANNDDTEGGAGRFSPGERYGRVYQINYLRCIFCGLCIEACPTRALTMTNVYELADNNRADLIFTKDQLLAPLQQGMLQPPFPMADGLEERDYYLGKVSSATDAQREYVEANTRTSDAGGDLVTSTGEAVLFYILGPLAVVGALGLVFARKAVHAAIGMAMTMIILGVFYIAQDADFLGVIQIFVYTGAVMMLFLFVLMLVGVDSSDSLVETLTGQRWATAVLSIGLAGILVSAIGQVSFGTSTGVAAINAETGNVSGVAQLIFGRYVWVFEMTSALLITAALGAMVCSGPPRAARARPEPARVEQAPLPARASTSPACRCPASTPGTTPSTPRRCCPRRHALAAVGLARAHGPRPEPLPEVYREAEAQIERDMQEGSDR